MKKGFTLIELLVVISIIGVLVAVAISSYTGAQIKARDARRRSDMKAIQSTMEQYYSTTGNNLYPDTVALAFGTNPVPVDPKNSTPYLYSSYDYIDTTANDSYCICALLEETGKGNASAGAASGCTWTGTLNLFCVQNQQ
ncbi:MAG: Type II secretion system pseudopilin OxpG [Microgenomates group bacterium GW2011_GWA2_46_16]|nr:MAG: Type II secretion system pseudopilin OxpG [Microgenomates group bacterium GW2011_GWA2_46_16]